MAKVRTYRVDVAIIGAGLAGLRAALAASEAGASVLVLSKGPTASVGVIGFNAAVEQPDSEAAFLADTLEGGSGLSDPQLAKILTAGARTEVAALEKLGLRFDRRDGAYHLLKPLGCSHFRLVHQGNSTGAASLRAMGQALARRRVTVRSRVVVLEILKNGRSVSGVLAVDAAAGEILLVEAPAVVMAAGGGGHVYAHSTYPTGINGDGYALAFRAGARLVDMEFVQYEPCHCIFPKRIGISTTLLAEGGELRNRREQRFVLKEAPAGEGSLSKNALARIIAAEIRAGHGTEHGGVYFDVRMLPAHLIKEDHASFYRRFLREGIDLTRQRVEVAPAPHTFLGGIKIDARCATGVPGLFAAGECTGGIHGANRLGGNAGTEVHVFGGIAGAQAAAYARAHRAALTPTHRARAGELAAVGPGRAPQRKWREGRRKLGEIMGTWVGPLRNEADLREAARLLDRLEAEFAGLEARSLPDVIAAAEWRSMLETGRIVVEAARLRRESRGVHHRTDYPERDDKHWLCNIEVARDRHGGRSCTVRRIAQRKEVRRHAR